MLSYKSNILSCNRQTFFILVLYFVVWKRKSSGFRFYTPYGVKEDGKMFERLKRAFGRRKSQATLAVASASVTVPPVETVPQGLTAEDEIVSALANASHLPTESLDQEANEAIDRIASLLADEPPKLKRGNPGGQEFTVRLTYNQNEWIQNTYANYVDSHSFAPFQRVMQVFVESYIRAVEERVNPPAAEISQTEYDATATEA